MALPVRRLAPGKSLGDAAAVPHSALSSPVCRLVDVLHSRISIPIQMELSRGFQAMSAFPQQVQILVPVEAFEVMSAQCLPKLAQRRPGRGERGRAAAPFRRPAAIFSLVNERPVATSSFASPFAHFFRTALATSSSDLFFGPGLTTSCFIDQLPPPKHPSSILAPSRNSCRKPGRQAGPSQPPHIHRSELTILFLLAPRSST